MESGVAIDRVDEGSAARVVEMRVICGAAERERERGCRVWSGASGCLCGLEDSLVGIPEAIL